MLAMRWRSMKRGEATATRWSSRQRTQVWSGRCIGMRRISTSLPASAWSKNCRPRVDSCTSASGARAWNPAKRGMSHFMASDGVVHTRRLLRWLGDFSAAVALAMRSRLACTSAK